MGGFLLLGATLALRRGYHSRALTPRIIEYSNDAGTDELTHAQGRMDFTNIAGIGATPSSVQGLMVGPFNVNGKSIVRVENNGNTSHT